MVSVFIRVGVLVFVAVWVGVPVGVTVGGVGGGWAKGRGTEVCPDSIHTNRWDGRRAAEGGPAKAGKQRSFLRGNPARKAEEKGKGGKPVLKSPILFRIPCQPPGGKETFTMAMGITKAKAVMGLLDSQPIGRERAASHHPNFPSPEKALSTKYSLRPRLQVRPR